MSLWFLRSNMARSSRAAAAAAATTCTCRPLRRLKYSLVSSVEKNVKKIGLPLGQTDILPSCLFAGRPHILFLVILIVTLTFSTFYCSRVMVRCILYTRVLHLLKRTFAFTFFFPCTLT